MRRQILRSALGWAPLFVFFTTVAVFFLVRAVTETGGAWIGFAIMGLIALLTLPLLVAALRDLRTDPVETEGAVQRKWRKNDFFIAKSHYLMVGKRVFRVAGHVWLEMPDVPGRVLLLHYPHTNTVVDWQRVDPPDDEAAEPASPLGGRPALASTPPAGAVRPPSFGASPAPRRVEQRERPARRVEPPRFGGSPGRQPGDAPDRSLGRRPGDPPDSDDA